MKSDLVKILPERLQMDLLWRASDPGPYSRFRDMIKTQAARTLLNQRRLPVKLFDDARQAPSEQDPAEGGDGPVDKINELEELLAFMKGRQRRSPGGDVARNPRKCPNCGEVHKELKCPYPKFQFLNENVGTATKLVTTLQTARLRSKEDNKAGRG